MPRALIPSDTSIRNIKPGGSRRRLSDGDGLYLLLFLNGGSRHAWRFDYSIHGRRKTLSLGLYPDTSLRLAREKAEAARRLVAAGVDPSQHRKDEKAMRTEQRDAERARASGQPIPGTFEHVSREWFRTKERQWAPAYGQKIIQRLERDIFPWIGTANIDTITPPQLLSVLRRIEERGAIETAHRALENCGQIFRFGIATGRATSNPGRDLKDALRRPSVVHFPAVTDPERLAQVLRAIASYNGTPVVKAALQLTPMLLLRPGELRQGTWEEIDLETATWTVPAARMKRELEAKRHGKPHVVPLPRQAVEILRALKPITGGRPDAFIFRGERNHKRPMSDAAVNAALRAMGFPQDEVTAHGFRATARTILAERLGFPDAVIEAQLAHVVKGALGAAYDRSEFLMQRRHMLTRWANYMDALRAGDNALGDNFGSSDYDQAEERLESRVG